MASVSFQTIVVHPSAENHPETLRLTEKTGAKIIVSESVPETIDGKSTLFITLFKGEPLKGCPATKNYLCCQYTILHLAYNCPFHCEYCILKSYLDGSHATFFANYQELTEQSFEQIAVSERFLRIGTGELTDSLAYEPVFNIAPYLVQKFSDCSNAILELKTKSVFVDHLLKLNHKKRTFISFSVNSDKIVSQCEKGCPTVAERMQAAKKCITAGYKIGLHLDPAVYYENAEHDYNNLLYNCISALGGENIVWVSIGSMRGMPGLFDKIRSKNPESVLLSGETIEGIDKKIRYFKTMRIRLYNAVLEGIFRANPDQCVYYCMESEEIWKKTRGFAPDGNESLSYMLDLRAQEFSQ